MRYGEEIYLFMAFHIIRNFYVLLHTDPVERYYLHTPLSYACPVDKQHIQTKTRTINNIGFL